MDKKTLIDKINNLSVNTHLYLPDDFPYVYLVFILDTNKFSGAKQEYSWKLQPKNRGGGVYPILSGNTIKFYKTLDGAKRNVIQHLDFLLKDME